MFLFLDLGFPTVCNTYIVFTERNFLMHTTHTYALSLSHFLPPSFAPSLPPSLPPSLHTHTHTHCHTHSHHHHRDAIVNSLGGVALAAQDATEDVQQEAMEMAAVVPSSEAISSNLAST